jgi:hypothetical protein
VRPTIVSAWAATSIMASRSIPVANAHVLHHVYELLGGNVAGRPGRVRTAAEAPTEASKSLTPSSSAASTFASPVPRVL